MSREAELQLLHNIVSALRAYRRVFGEIPMSIRFSESQAARDRLEKCLKEYEDQFVFEPKLVGIDQ